MHFKCLNLFSVKNQANRIFCAKWGKQSCKGDWQLNKEGLWVLEWGLV
jgi:hypothetical protein